MIILAIDPGTEQSAWVIYDPTTERILAHGIEGNDSLVGSISRAPEIERFKATHLVIEWFESYGMPVGREVFEAIAWVGRMEQAWGEVNRHRVTRGEIKLHLCGTKRAKDPNVRAALIDRFGKPGVKSAPGLLYGIKGDEWSAVAVAVTWADLHAKETR